MTTTSNPGSTGQTLEKNDKCGYPHFMLKEMFEQPEAIRRTLEGLWDRLETDSKGSDALFGTTDVTRLQRIVVVGMGTARHAGLVGRAAIQQLAGVPVEVEFASEFRDAEPLLPYPSLVIAISQSGETGDTLAAVREAQRHGVAVMAVTNVEGSSLARLADTVVYTRAGRECAVPSTKAYLAQLVALYAVALHLGRRRGRLDTDGFARWRSALNDLPTAVSAVLERHAEAEAAAQGFTERNQAFFIGRGLDWATAMEGALKLKEVAYIHAEAYAAGEFRHGSQALLQPDDRVVAICTQPRSAERLAGNVREIVDLGGRVWLVSSRVTNGLADGSVDVFRLPPVDPLLAPVVSVVPLQMLAYYTGCLRGCEIDNPRYLRKSVTSE